MRLRAIVLYAEIDHVLVKENEHIVDLEETDRDQEKGIIESAVGIETVSENVIRKDIMLKIMEENVHVAEIGTGSTEKEAEKIDIGRETGIARGKGNEKQLVEILNVNVTENANQIEGIRKGKEREIVKVLGLKGFLCAKLI